MKKLVHFTHMCAALFCLCAAQSLLAEDVVYDHANVKQYADERGQLQAVQSPADWAKRRAAILQGMQQAMGELPSREELVDLDVRVVDERKGEGFVRKTITFAAEAGDRIPADLYVPNEIAAHEKRPAMLALHPTGPLGKRIVAGDGPRANRQYGLELAQRGYVVICPDYPSFGDYEYDFEADRYVSGSMKGIFNHMRCVDLLQSLPYVDAERIGVIGHSLGGHNAMFVGAFDERLRVIVSSCGWTPFHDYYQGQIAGWTSPRYMPRLKDVYELDPDRVPFDFYEVVAALAPRHFFSCSPTADSNFEVAGVKKAIPIAKEVYELLGAADNLQVRYPECEHDFPDATREEAYAFIDAALKQKPNNKQQSATTSARQPTSETWQAGVAKTVITPATKIWLSGYAGRDHPAEGTLHDIWAKALVLQDPAGHRAAIVTLDLIGIDRDLSRQVCRRLESEYGLSREQIALATSHTHTGPVVGTNLRAMYFLDERQETLVDQYSAELVDKIVKTVGQAIAKLEPAMIAQGLGTAEFAVNRRNNVEANVPQLREENKLLGPIDHEVPVLAVRNQANELKAILFGYACHATVLSFYQISGDWPGFAQIEIEKRHPGAVAMFWAGCGADQNPLPRRTVELAEKYGQEMADAVDKVLPDGLQPVPGRLRTAYREIDLKFAALPSKNELEATASSANKYEASRAKLLLKEIAANGQLSPTYAYPLQLWQLGDSVTFVILGGEVVVDYSIRIKHELDEKGRRVWVAGYANDVMAYIPSKRVLGEGGYEGASSMIYYGQPTSWSPEVEDHIVATVRELAESKVSNQ